MIVKYRASIIGFFTLFHKSFIYNSFLLSIVDRCVDICVPKIIKSSFPVMTRFAEYIFGGAKTGNRLVQEQYKYGCHNFKQIKTRQFKVFPIEKLYSNLNFS